MPSAMIGTQETAGLRSKLWAEGKTVLFLFIYLALLLGAFVNYRRLILAEYQIAYFQYGYTLIRSLIPCEIDCPWSLPSPWREIRPLSADHPHIVQDVLV